MSAPAVGAPQAPSGPRAFAPVLGRPWATLIGFLVLLAALLLGQTGWAGEPGDPGSGTLLMRAKDGDAVVEAVRLGTDVDMRVSGLTARVRVTQAFRNTTSHWVEAVYVYPLPDDGAVDTLKMVVGDRVIVGEIRKKAEAQAIYDQAKEKRQKAALAEQDRPNMFSNSVANIGPGQTVLVQIEYQAPVNVSGGQYSLRLPLVVGPRYTPDGQAAPVEGQAPRLDPAVYSGINPVTITVHLRPGFPLADIVSAAHAIRIADDHGGKLITLAGGPVPADRDFVLTWKPTPAGAPSLSLFHEKVAGADYVLAQITPPVAPHVGAPLARDVVFVIDNSGSMEGESIRQAKASLLYGLAQLKPGDRFNVVRFDNTLSVLYSDVVPADAGHLANARAFVSGLEAAGGTEMVPAMQAALSDAHATETGRMRQVVFLTDGDIGNEAQLFDTIAAGRGRSRVFMVGIGSAPNTYLMTRAAELGRGSFTHIGSTDTVETTMRQLFDKLENPVVTNLTAMVEGASSDMAPATLSDLYRGEPVTVAAKVGAMKGVLKISGLIDGKWWEARIALKDAEPGQGVSKLWARRKITDAEVARSLSQITDDQADARILALGLEHHLITSQTSLVAVDKTPSRPAGAPLTRADLPLDLPAGWDFDSLFKPSHDGGKGERTGEAGQPVAGADLPQTATDAPALIALGLGLLALGAALGAGGWLVGGQRRIA